MNVIKKLKYFQYKKTRFDAHHFWSYHNNLNKKFQDHMSKIYPNVPHFPFSVSITAIKSFQQSNPNVLYNGA